VTPHGSSPVQTSGDPDSLGQFVGEVFADLTGVARILAGPVPRWFRDPERSVLPPQFLEPGGPSWADAARSLNVDHSPDWQPSDPVA
jgi:hypothetical protein